MCIRDRFGTASYATQALSASFAPSTPAFPFTGSAIVSGSLTIIGNTAMTGSLIVSSSIGVTGSINVIRTTAGSCGIFENNSYNLAGGPPILVKDGLNSLGLGYGTATAYFYTPAAGLYIHGYGSYGTYFETGNVVIPNKLQVGSSNTTTGAKIHIAAGTATALTAPIKFTSGTNLTTPEAGAIEFDGNSLFFTTGSTRSTLLTSINPTSITGSAIITGSLKVIGNTQITGSLYNSSFAFISGGLVVGSELGGYVQSGNHKSQIIAAGTQTPLMIQGGSGAVEIWKDSTPSRAVSFGMAIPGGSITNDFVFSAYQSSWAEIMRITSAGSVGIGTATPNAKLDVNGNAVITGSLLLSGSSLVAGITPIPLAGTIKDGVTSVLGSLNDWNSNYYQGDILYSETAGGTITFGQLCYRTQNENWELADATAANSAAAFNMLGICVKSSTSTNPTSILINGFVETAAYATIVKSGEPLYMSITPGSMTKTAPTTVGNAVRIIGHTFWDSNSQGMIVIRFNPENSWIEL